MPTTALREMPDEARLWMFILEAPLEGEGLEGFQKGVGEAVSAWRHKGKAYEGAWELRDDQMLLVGEPTMAEAPSGCAIEGLTTRIRRLAEGAGTSLVDEQAVVYVDCGGFQALSREKVPEALAAGRLTATTPVVDRSLFTVGDLRQRGLTQGLAHTWIGRKFLRA